MRIKWLLSLGILISACLLTSVLVADAAGPGNKKVLVLNSYHSGYKGSDDIVQGFRDTLFTSLPETEMQIEYLDSKHFNGNDFDSKILDLLRFKYQRRHFDLIISTDDYAFDILDRHRKIIFGETPVVFCGTNSFDSARLIGKTGIIGIDERPSFSDTLDLIFKIHPATGNIVIIHDDSITGRLNSGEFRLAAAPFEKRAKFSYLSGLRLDELVRRVKLLQPGSVIVYFASFAEDSSGERISSGESLQTIAAASPVPIYGGWEFNLGKGIVGGRLIDLHEHGVLSAKLAIRILNGEWPVIPASVIPSPNTYMFDYAEMRRFGVSEKLLPPGRIVINKPPPFLWAHRFTILMLISSTLLVALIVSFVQLVRSRKMLRIQRDELARHNDELEKALSTVRQLEGIIPICMYCKKIRDDKESWHQLEAYITEHSEAVFSHGICPACTETVMHKIGDLNRNRTEP
ncbi:MAG: hypothetical protein C0402_16125 [Thermodesulfovibrio sp.]|nr:hypothetical protein [Thermodesulfovibrio sp.]